MKKEKTKKLHFEVLSINSIKMDKYIEDYNKDNLRVTPKIKYADVINKALDKYLTKREKDFNTGKTNEKE
jgi:hypothetical protein